MSEQGNVVRLLTVSQNDPMTVTRADVYEDFDQACNEFTESAGEEAYEKFEVGLYEVEVERGTGLDDLKRELSGQSASIIKGTSELGETVDRVALKPAQDTPANENEGDTSDPE